jgi:hypothetical protein
MFGLQAVRASQRRELGEEDLWPRCAPEMAAALATVHEDTSYTCLQHYLPGVTPEAGRGMLLWYGICTAPFQDTRPGKDMAAAVTTLQHSLQAHVGSPSYALVWRTTDPLVETYGPLVLGVGTHVMVTALPSGPETAPPRAWMPEELAAATWPGVGLSVVFKRHPNPRHPNAFAIVANLEHTNAATGAQTRATAVLAHAIVTEGDMTHHAVGAGATRGKRERRDRDTTIASAAAKSRAADVLHQLDALVCPSTTRHTTLMMQSEIAALVESLDGLGIAMPGHAARASASAGHTYGPGEGGRL